MQFKKYMTLKTVAKLFLSFNYFSFAFKNRLCRPLFNVIEQKYAVKNNTDKKNLTLQKRSNETELFLSISKIVSVLKLWH